MNLAVIESDWINIPETGTYRRESFQSRVKENRHTQKTYYNNTDYRKIFRIGGL